jgi:hypothetical protein
MSEHFSTIRRKGRVILAVATVAGTAVLGCLARLARPIGPARRTGPDHMVRPVWRVRPGLRMRWGRAVRWSRWARWSWLVRAERSRSPRPVPVAPARGGDWRVATTLRAMPRQIVPSTDAVDLTPAERAAFAGLVRQFSEGRH